MTIKNPKTTTAWAVIFTSLLLILFLVAKTAANQTEVLDRQTVILDTINKNSKTRSQQIQRLSDRMDCFFIYFSKPNRQNLVISDIDKCVIESTETGQPINNFPLSATTAPKQTPPRNNASQSTTPPGQGGTQNPGQPTPEESGLLQGATDFINQLIGGLL